MSYDRFCKRHKAFTVSKNVVSRVGRKAGRTMEVDWSGPTMRLVDPATGEISKACLFVACLPFSSCSYVEPTLDMKKDTWLQCFLEEEKPLLRPLPQVSYEICEWVYGRKVQANCHVSYGRNFYSVSHLLVGKEVDLRVGESRMEAFCGGERVATHLLFPPHARNRYSTNAGDMPEGRSFSEWDAPRIRRWADRVGPSCRECVDGLFASCAHDEQAFNGCLALLRLSNRYCVLQY